MKPFHSLLIAAIFLLACQSMPEENKYAQPKPDPNYVGGEEGPTKPAPVTYSNNAGSSGSFDETWEKLETVFEGNHSRQSMETMFKRVMETHEMAYTADNLLKVGNMLYVLRTESAVGVTEMDILKHMYQNGNSSYSLSQQAGISAAAMERTK